MKENTGSDAESQREERGFPGIIGLITLDFGLKKWAWFCQENEGKDIWATFQELLGCAKGKGVKSWGWVCGIVAVVWSGRWHGKPEGGSGLGCKVSCMPCWGIKTILNRRPYTRKEPDQHFNKALVVIGFAWAQTPPRRSRICPKQEIF